MATCVEDAVVNAFLHRNPMLATQWDKSDVRQQRSLLCSAVERVWVARAPGRGHRFDPERRLRIVWTGEMHTE